MSAFSGPQQRGARRALREIKRTEAEQRAANPATPEQRAERMANLANLDPTKYGAIHGHRFPASLTSTLLRGTQVLHHEMK